MIRKNPSRDLPLIAESANVDLVRGYKALQNEF